MKPRFAKRQLFLSAIVFAALPVSLSAQIVWDGSESTDFEDGLNWIGDSAPVNDESTDTAQLTGGTVALSISRSVGGLDLNSATTLEGAGNTLTVGSTLTGSADLAISNTSVFLKSANNALNYTGNMTISGGGTLISQRDSLKLDTGTHGSTTITLDDGEISATGDHLDMTGRNIVLGASGGTLRHAHARNIYGLSGVVISGAGENPGELTISNQNGASGSTAGRVQLEGANTYQGGTNITHGGQAWVYSDASFGAAGTGVRMSDGGTYYAANGVNMGTRVFTIEAGSEAENARFHTNNKTTTLGGNLAGSAAFDVVGSGTLNLTADNSTTFSGDVNIYGDTTVKVNRRSLDLAAGTGTITLEDGGTLSANDSEHIEIDGRAIVLNGTGGTLEQSGGRNIFGQTGISGVGKLTLSSTGNNSGRIQLSTNTYEGGTEIINGALVRVQSGDGTFGLAGTSVELTDGYIHFSSGYNDATTPRAYILGATAHMKVFNNQTATLNGVISGANDLTVESDGGQLVLAGSNTYSGGTTIEGLVRVGAAGVDGPNTYLGTGDVTLNDTDGARGRIQNNDNHAELANNLIISNASNGGKLIAGWNKSLTISGVVSGSGDLTVVGDSGTVILGGANTHSGNIALTDANSKLKVTGSLGSGSYAGVISGDGTLEIASGGTQTLTGANTYTGSTTVSGNSTLIINGASSSSSLNIEAGSTLGGSSNLGDLTIAAGGFHNPGNSPGIATTGNYTMAGTLNIEVEGTVAGTQHDQVQATGSVDITGGSLTTAFSAGTYLEGDLLFILLNDGTDAITGTFSGFNEGDVVANYGGFNWEIGYTADSVSNSITGGNDIALLAVVPEPSAALLGSLGLLALLRRRRS